MAEPRTRTMPYRDLVRAVLDHHQARGELVDFWLMKGGAIVGHYRVRPDAAAAWTDLLPTGTSAERYHQTIQRLAPILFPGQAVSIDTVERGDELATVTYQPSA